MPLSSLLFVEVVDLCVGYEDIVIVKVVVEEKVGLVEGYPHWDSVRKAGHSLLSVVEEGIRKGRRVELKMQRLIHMGEHDHRSDTVRQACIDEIIIVVKAWLVDW